MSFEDFMFLLSMNLLVDNEAFIPYALKDFIKPGVESLNEGFQDTGIKYFSIEGINQGQRGYYIKQKNN